MKKKTKRLTTVAVLASIIAGASVLAVAETQTHFFSGMFEEEHRSNGVVEVALSEMLADAETEKATLKQEVEITDEQSPFEKIEVNYQLYGTEKTPATIELGDDYATLNYVSEVEIRFELKEDVEFYVSSLTLDNFSYLTEDGEMDLENQLSVEVKVDGKKFDRVTSASQDLWISHNAYSGDIVVTIRNQNVVEGEPSTFTIGQVKINTLDSFDWTPVVVEETEE